MIDPLRNLRPHPKPEDEGARWQGFDRLREGKGLLPWGPEGITGLEAATVGLRGKGGHTLRGTPDRGAGVVLAWCWL